MNNDTNIENLTPEQRVKLLEDSFTQRREYWMNWVTEMTKCLKYMDKLTDLQVEVFSRRQEALENYHTLSNILAKRSKLYKEKYALIYNNLRPIKVSPGSTTFMYGTERAITDQIEAQLSADKYIIDLTESQMNYMSETVKTIDGIIYNINSRIKIEEIKIGK
jgi:hypothetical protein